MTTAVDAPRYTWHHRLRDYWYNNIDWKDKRTLDTLEDLLPIYECWSITTWLRKAYLMGLITCRELNRFITYFDVQS